MFIGKRWLWACQNKHYIILNAVLEAYTTNNGIHKTKSL